MLMDASRFTSQKAQTPLTLQDRSATIEEYRFVARVCITITHLSPRAHRTAGDWRGRWWVHIPAPVGPACLSLPASGAPPAWTLASALAAKHTRRSAESVPFLCFFWRQTGRDRETRDHCCSRQVIYLRGQLVTLKRLLHSCPTQNAAQKWNRCNIPRPSWEENIEISRHVPLHVDPITP